MNRFLKKGLILIVAGVALNVVGYLIKKNDWWHYGWAMIIGTVLFGIGFLLVFYSFVRKVEYQGLIEEREAEAKKRAKRKAHSRRYRRSLQMH